MSPFCRYVIAVVLAIVFLTVEGKASSTERFQCDALYAIALCQLLREERK